MPEIMWIGFQGPSFTMRVPSNWVLTATPELQVVVLEPERPAGELRANLIVSLRPVTEGLTSAAVLESTRKNQLEQYPHFKLHEEGVVNGRKGEGSYQNYTWLNPENSIPVAQVQAFFVANKMLYSITTTCDERRAKAVMYILGEMLNSFQII
jgi:hypothetical protein